MEGRVLEARWWKRTGNWGEYVCSRSSKRVGEKKDCLNAGGAIKVGSSTERIQDEIERPRGEMRG